MAAPALWNLTDETLHADCSVFRVFKRIYKHPRDARVGVFFTIKSRDWVLALPVTTGGQLVFTRQFRVGTGALSWEPPGGIMEAGENPITAAQREMTEETGYTGKRARLIGTCAPNPAIFDNTSHFVLVEDCELTHPVAFDATEELETVLLAPREAEAMVQRGEISHVIAQAALYRLRLARPDLF
ncbi:MAG: NUDIX hydrolase [Puniceicoccales bacterium]|jgi:8-oxo-dGTP pyrophosphatase MutT (NUDIX family)|nr:NUDIX hydrolase [Puniceicoccales bacterium]